MIEKMFYRAITFQITWTCGIRPPFKTICSIEVPTRINRWRHGTTGRCSSIKLSSINHRRRGSPVPSGTRERWQKILTKMFTKLSKFSAVVVSERQPGPKKCVRAMVFAAWSEKLIRSFVLLTGCLTMSGGGGGSGDGPTR